ncbi:MAG: hypothetical protein WBD16_14320 [Pyrinomonadaceae bacterium]
MKSANIAPVVIFVMPEITDNANTFDPNIQSEDIAFDRDELIACNGCGRANPPNRFNCIYCAHELEISTRDTAATRFTSRKLETWERGFNLILVRHLDAGGNCRPAADLLRVEIATLNEIVQTEPPLPVARVESEKEAALIRTRLEEIGFICSVVSDDELAANKPHVRLSAMELTDETLDVVSFNTKERIKIAWNDMAPIVSGILTKGRVDSIEKKRRHGKTKLIDETATSSDEEIFDLYTRDDATGFRVHQAGFDFSCLGNNKGLLASENMRLLIVELKQRAPNAKYVNSYGQLRHLLNDVWEIESRKDFHGLQRSGVGKVESATVASTSNLVQFNKFSRLQWHLR